MPVPEVHQLPLFLLLLARHRWREVDGTLQLIATITSAYLSFFVAEHVASGTVAALVDSTIVSLDKVAFLDLLQRGHAAGKSSSRYASANMGYPTEDEIISVISAIQDPRAMAEFFVDSEFENAELKGGTLDDFYEGVTGSPAAQRGARSVRS